MARYRVPNGSTLDMQLTKSAVGNAITNVTNHASAPVVSQVAHGHIVGDIIVLTLGWSRLNGRAFRVGSVPTVDTFTLDLVDTSDTTVYPQGSDTGSCYRILTWVAVQQVMNTNKSGGEQQFKTFQFMEDDAQRRLRTSKTPYGLEITIADDSSLPGFAALQVADDDRQARVLRANLIGGDKIYYNGQVSFDPTPSLTVDELMACDMTMSLEGKPTRYNAP
jgi:hypothetical protein